MACMPPYVAQVPTATTAQARGRQPIDPCTCGDRLSGGLVRAQRGPIAFLLVALVGNGAFDHQDERSKLAVRGPMEGLQEFVAIVLRQERVMEVDLRDPGNPPNTISSMLGCMAAVMAIVSPSQPRPAVIQSTSICWMQFCSPLLTAGSMRTHLCDGRAANKRRSRHQAISRLQDLP